MKKRLLLFVALIVVIILTCVGCGEAEHVHVFSGNWTVNQTHHWHAAICEHKDEVDGYAEHSYSKGVCAICNYKLYNASEVLQDFNPEELSFGGLYNMNLPSDVSFDLLVWAEDNKTPVDGVLRLNDDMSLEVIGIMRRGYFNIVYDKEKLYDENIFFNITTEQLTEKIRAELRDQDMNSDIITSENLQFVTELNLSELFLNNARALGGLRYMTNLTSLDLSNNGLSDTDINVLSNMRELTYLNLSHNNITAIESLKNSINIKVLDLSYNQIDTTKSYNAIGALNRFAHLNTLNLEHNSIENISPISNLTELVSLKLNANKITPSSIDSIVGLTDLKEISLAYNEALSDLSTFYSLQYVNDLKAVDLSGINLHQQFASSGNVKFPASDNLEKLVVSDSNLTDSDIADLIIFPNLQTLDISKNNLSVAGLNTYFKNAEQLENVNISSLSIVELPDLKVLKALKSFTCDNCNSLYNIELLYTSDLGNLTELSIDNCNSIKFSDNYTMHGIDEIVGKMPSLQSLSIVNGIHWLNSAMYENLQKILSESPDKEGSINYNDIEIELFKDEIVSYENYKNYPRIIYFSLQDLLNASVVNNDFANIKYLNGKNKCVLSLVNDYEAKNINKTIVISQDFFEFSIYGIVNESYPLSVKVDDRKKAKFDLILDNCILTGNNSHIIQTPNESIVTITAGGERVELNAKPNMNAVLGYDIELKCDADTAFKAKGGDGLNGNKGFTSKSSSSVPYTARKGEDGTTGISAIHCHSLKIDDENSSNITLIGGKGGNGGDGGDSQSGSPEWGLGVIHSSGGPGGNAGNGGPAVAYIKSIDTANATLSGGEPGLPGYAGAYDSHLGTTKGFYIINGTPGKKGGETLVVDF